MSQTRSWPHYRPTNESPWNLQRVVHLHRRAGFAGTWDELQRDLKDGPDATIERVLTGRVTSQTPPEYESISRLLADSAVASGDINRLKAWWVYRMFFGPDPLGEKLTLLWHDHFATGYAKVQDVGLMRRQNEVFREHSRGKFADLLNASLRQPALLHYLDAQTNRKGHPNENLGRELMELFTLGVGPYTETDVKEAARALTGWTIAKDQFAIKDAHHDAGMKTILGRKGTWTGSDLVKILLEHPATSERIAFKLCRLFFGEKAITSEGVAALAEGLREHDLDIGWAVGVIVRSDRFFADANIRSRVLDPVEFVVASARALGMFDPAPSTLALADWASRIGQALFDPPNVGGWPTGREWVHPRSLILRANYVTALLHGPNVGRPTPYTSELAVGDLLTFHHRLLFGTDPTPELHERAAGRDTLQILAMLLASPEGQLS